MMRMLQKVTSMDKLQLTLIKIRQAFFLVPFHTTSKAWVRGARGQKWVCIESGKGRARYCNSHRWHYLKDTKYAPMCCCALGLPSVPLESKYRAESEGELFCHSQNHATVGKAMGMLLSHLGLSTHPLHRHPWCIPQEHVYILQHTKHCSGVTLSSYLAVLNTGIWLCIPARRHGLETWRFKRLEGTRYRQILAQNKR